MEHRKRNRNREKRIERRNQKQVLQLSRYYGIRKDKAGSTSLPYELLIKSGCM